MRPKTCLIAGIGPGLGLSVAKAFAAKGYNIAMMARTESALQTYKTEIERLGANAFYAPTDLTDPDSVERSYKIVEQSAGTPDVVIYNAGRWVEKSPTEWSANDFMNELSLCMGAAHQLFKLSYEGMQKLGSGAYLFTGGGLALYPQYGKDVIALTSGKSALRGYAISLDSFLSKTNIRASIITIAGQVVPNTPFDPDIIATRFIDASEQSFTSWQSEIIFDGK